MGILIKGEIEGIKKQRGKNRAVEKDLCPKKRRPQTERRKEEEWKIKGTLRSYGPESRETTVLECQAIIDSVRREAGREREREVAFK